MNFDEGDEFDERLRAGDPSLPVTDRQHQLVAHMVEETTPVRSRRGAPIAIAVATAALVLGGGMAAAAATGIWAPWAENDPLAILHYELPSGASCEMRVGNIQGAPAGVDSVIRDALSGVTVSDSQVTEWAQSSGDPRDPLSDDGAYQSGYNWAVVTLMEDALTTHGLDPKWAKFDAQGVCR